MAETAPTSKSVQVQPPLTPYDFLGYLAPSATMLLCVLGLEALVKHFDKSGIIHAKISTPLLTIYASVKTSRDDWLAFATFAFLLIAAMYVLGHVIATMSSFAIDRTLVFRGYGYPFEQLMRETESPETLKGSVRDQLAKLESAVAAAQADAVTFTRAKYWLSRAQALAAVLEQNPLNLYSFAQETTRVINKGLRVAHDKSEAKKEIFRALPMAIVLGLLLIAIFRWWPLWSVKRLIVLVAPVLAFVMACLLARRKKAFAYVVGQVARPVQYLAEVAASNSNVRQVERVSFRALFFWINASLLVCYCARTFAGYEISLRCVIVILGAVFLVWSWAHKNRWKNFAGKALTLAALPYEFVAGYVANFISSRRPFEGDLRELFACHYHDKFSIRHELQGTDGFWLPYLYVLDHSPNLAPILTNWLRLYAFNRNVATAFYAASLYLGVWTAHASGVLKGLAEPDKQLFGFYPVVVFLLSFVMLVRFYYLYHCYFTKNIVRGFIITCQNDAAKSDRNEGNNAR
jgi:hypothetical protein